MYFCEMYSTCVSSKLCEFIYFLGVVKDCCATQVRRDGGPAVVTRYVPVWVRPGWSSPPQLHRGDEGEEEGDQQEQEGTGEGHHAGAF